MDSNASSGGGRRNRGRGKRNNNNNNNKRNNAGSSTTSNKGNSTGSASGSGGGNALKKNAVPPPPQVKLSIRHIGNPTVYGTTKAILEELLLPLVDACNAKMVSGTSTSASTSASANAGVPSITSSGTLTGSTSVTASSSFFLEVDVAAKRHLIHEEEAAQKYMKAWKSEEAVNNNIDGEIPVPDDSDKQDAQRNGEGPAKDHGTIDVITAPPSKPPGNVPVISLRPLYVVPPKKTRRRGDRPGIAYILLTAPKIEKIEIPETVPEHGIPKVVASTTDSDLSSKDEGGTSPHSTKNADVTTTSTTGGTSDTSAAPGPKETTPAAVSSGSVTLVPVSSTASIKKSFDYSRQVAQGRVLLQNAIEMLTQVTSAAPRQESNKGQLQQSEVNTISILVEPAMSGKTWRWQYTRPDRREGTIESTADYKNWMASLEKQQADLKARPKPTPGGGFVTSSDDGTAAATTSGGPSTGQPIAALVQHLRAKQQDLKRKKVKKKKDTPSAGTGTLKDGKKQQGGKVGKNSKKTKPTIKTDDPDATGKKKAKKATKKKGTGGGRSNPKAVAPTALLKPTTGS